MESSFFAYNRQRLGGQLQPNSFVVLTSFTSMQGDNDEAAPFHQEGNFWYLTGIEEPDWRLLIDIDSNEEWLIAPQRSFARQAFDGGITAKQATAISGVRNVVDKKQGREIFKRLIARKKRAYTVKPQNMRAYGFAPNPAQRRLVAELHETTVIDIRLLLAKLRAIKQPQEILALQAAIDATIDGLQKLAPRIPKYRFEYEADADLTYEFRRRGLVHAFEPIIAAGKNACVLHHPLPKDPIAQNDWLLMDVGAKVNGYAADITRTFPIGQPSERHIAIYEAVRRSNEYVFSVLRPGVSVKEYLSKSYQFVGEELKKLGLIDTIKMDYTSVFKYMPHAIGHGLGVDVHDPLGRPEYLQENMVLTVEVGIYVPEEGIGVRLEDDALITKDGVENMSQALPIELAALQKMIY